MRLTCYYLPDEPGTLPAARHNLLPCYLAFDAPSAGRIRRAACLSERDGVTSLVEIDERNRAEMARLLQWLAVATAPIGRVVFVDNTEEARFCLRASAAVCAVPMPPLNLCALGGPSRGEPLPTSLVPALVQRVWRLRRLARKVQETAAC